jgi:hypothetical protein
MGQLKMLITRKKKRKRFHPSISSSHVLPSFKERLSKTHAEINQVKFLCWKPYTGLKA